ncbi:MAG: hypothetical protein NT023_16265, partial [Armatimonadetes bacterium]|nr:hypothetical protein [Armatimonadota bacterium]
MKVLSIRIPGRFEDAFIYQGHLLAITEDLSMRRYSLEGLVDSLHSEFPSGQPVLEHLFLRNDWLCNAQFKALFSISGIPQSFMSLFEGLEALTINTERTLTSVKEETLEFPAQVIL